MNEPFVDERGFINDLLGPVDAVTFILTREGAVRGNHFHERTTQWTYVMSGSLLIANGSKTQITEPGQMVVHEPGVPHAWKALKHTACLVFTRGPRSGENYETDVVRLDEPLL